VSDIELGEGGSSSLAGVERDGRTDGRWRNCR